MLKHLIGAAALTLFSTAALADNPRVQLSPHQHRKLLALC